MGFDKSSIMFGLGLGIVAAALIIFFGVSISSGVSVNEPETVVETIAMTEEEIVAEARELGMVFANEIEPADTPAPMPPETGTPDLDETANEVLDEVPEEATGEATDEATDEAPEPEETPSPTPSPRPVVADITTVNIPKAATTAEITELLRLNSVITDPTEFESYLENNLGGGTVAEGIYILPTTGDYHRILDILLDR